MSGSSGTLEWVIVALAAVFGLLVGSFLNVVVYRAPLGLSVSTPRSFCPTCDRQLTWWENVPLVSWLALRGRCHTCHEPISARYPLVEVVTAAAFALITWAWAGSALSAGYCALAATAIAVGLIEFGGTCSPLSVGATGAALGQVLLVVAALWLERWSVLGWSCAGLVAGALAFGLLRARDADCRDPRWHGRTLLPAVGCWLGGIGGLGGHGAVAGLAAWILAEFACLVVLWITSDRSPQGDRRPQGGGRVTRIAGVPFVTGMSVAMAVSLGVAG